MKTNKQFNLATTLLFLSNGLAAEQTVVLPDAVQCISKVQAQDITAFSECQQWNEYLNSSIATSLDERAAAMYFLSIAQSFRKQKAEALQSAKSALELAKTTTDLLLYLRCAFYYANFLFENKRFTESEVVLEEALKHYTQKKKSITEDILGIVRLLGDNQRMQKKYFLAKEKYLVTLNTLQQLKRQQSLDYAVVLNNLAICLDFLGEKENSYALYYKAAEIAALFSIEESKKIYSNLLASLKESKDFERAKFVEEILTRNP